MCSLKAAKIHGRPFRPAKNLVQPSAALDSFLPNGKKIWYIADLSSLLLALHGESVCPKMGTDFIPKSEIINKCVAYRPDISLMSHLEYNQFPFLDTRIHYALFQSDCLCNWNTFLAELCLKNDKICAT